MVMHILCEQYFGEFREAGRRGNTNLVTKQLLL